MIDIRRSPSRDHAAVWQHPPKQHKMERVGVQQFHTSGGDWVDDEIARLHAVVAERGADETAAFLTARSPATRRGWSRGVRLPWARRRGGRRIRRSAGAIISQSELPWYAVAAALALLAGWVVVALTANP